MNNQEILNDLTAEIESAKNEKEAAIKNLNIIKEKVTEYNSLLAVKSEEYNSVNMKLNTAMSRLNEFNANLNEVELRISSSKRYSKELEDEIESNNLKVKEIEERIVSLEISANSASKNRNEEIEKLEEVKSQVADETSKYEKMKSDRIYFEENLPILKQVVDLFNKITSK